MMPSLLERLQTHTSASPISPLRRFRNRRRTVAVSSQSPEKTPFVLCAYSVAGQPYPPPLGRRRLQPTATAPTRHRDYRSRSARFTWSSCIYLCDNAHTILTRDSDDPATRLIISPSYEDDKLTSIKPLIPRTFSYTGSRTPATANNHHHQQRCCRTASETALYSLVVEDGDHESLGPNVAHAAAETYLITRLSLKLLGYLGVGYRWVTRFAALGVYACLLMPGFIQVGYYYFFSSQVRRSIVYGDQPRNSCRI